MGVIVMGLLLVGMYFSLVLIGVSIMGWIESLERRK